MCSDYEAYGLKKHGLTRSDCICFVQYIGGSGMLVCVIFILGVDAPKDCRG